MGAPPISPLPRFTPREGEDGGEAQEELEDVVRDEDTDLGSII